jgi:hypothetical protein
MRFPYFAIIWVGYVTLAGISLFQETNSFVLVLFTLAALAATVIVMQSLKPDSPSQTLSSQEYEKAKRSPDTSLNSSLLALLDDSDREVLRQQIMQRLSDSIQSSSDGELTTLEALLAEQNHRSRR